MVSRHKLTNTIAAILIVAGATALRAGEEREADAHRLPGDIAGAIADRQYVRAVEMIDALLGGEGEDADVLLYYKGLSLFQAKKYEDALSPLGEVERAHSKSPWAAKARFTKAKALLALRRFKEAEAIYEADAKRLLAPERKRELAGVLIAIAEELCAPVDETKPDGRKPDYERAYTLYRAAIDMEIDRDLKNDCMFRLAATKQSAEQWNEAVRDFSAYLAAFDPKFEHGRGVVEKAGRHIHDARLRLGISWRKQGRRLEARRTFEDLVALLEEIEERSEEEDRLAAQAMFETGLTYAVGDVHETLLAIKARRAFIKAYPSDDHAVGAAFEIAAYYEQIGRHDEAIAAYRDFLDGKGLRPESEKAKEDSNKFKLEARFKLGQIQLARKKYDDAKAIFGDYIANHPNGPHWSRCQQGIIEADFRVGSDLMKEKEYEAARAKWETFLVKYPLEGRNQEIMYNFGEMHRLRAEAIKDSDDDADARRRELHTKAIEAWKKLVGKYANTEVASRAQYMIAFTHEMKLGDLEQALVEYRKCTWGQFANNAGGRIRQMTKKELALLSERIWRTSEAARVKVQLRNIEKATVNVYRLDLADYFRKTHGVRGVEELDTLLINADETLEVDVVEYAKYKPIEQEIEIPMAEGAPGACAVRVTAGDLTATVLVLRSDLDIIVKASRKALLVFAENMPESKAWSGVKVLASDGKKVFFEGTTGEDGVLLEEIEKLKDAESVSVFAFHEGHIASNRLATRGMALSKGLSPKGYVYTDRTAYRPGQRVNVRAILREVADGSYAFEAGQTWTLEIVDSAGRVLETEKLPLSAFGTIAHAFELDPFAATGEYTIRVRRPNGSTFSGAFRVEQYKLEKMELVFELDQKILFRGEELTGKLVARYYYGEPIAGREVKYVTPDGRWHRAKTNDDGEVALTFDTTDFGAEAMLRLGAEIVGENVRATAQVFLAIRAFTLGVSVPRDVYVSGEPFDVTVRATDVEGKPVAEKLKLKVLERTSAPDGTFAEVLAREEGVTTEEETGRGAATIKLEKGGHYILRAEGTDRFDNPVTAETVVFISDDEDKTKLRIFTDVKRFKVGEAFEATLHNRLEKALALLTFEGAGIISYRLVELAHGENDVKVAVDHAHFPNFTLAAATMVANKFYTAAQSFDVERALAVTIKPDKESYEPGETATVEIVATDQLGNPVSAELSMAMVDEALFGLFPDGLAKIGDFFAQDVRREAGMRTTTSCTFSYAAKTERVPEALLTEKERLVRADLEEGREKDARDAAEKLAEFAAGGPQGGEGGGVTVRVGSAFRMKKDRSSRAAGKPASAPREEARRRFGRGGKIDSDSDHADYFFDGSSDSLMLGEAGPPATRRVFPETAYWNASIITDKEGKATVKIEAPSTTTRWRLLARGTTAETLVGEGRAAIATKKDFFVELKLPQIVGEGDTLRIIARVHNLTDYKGPVGLTLALDGGQEKADLTAKVELAGRGIAEHIFKAYKVGEAKALSATLTAKAGALSDSLARSVPIRPYGLEFTDSRSTAVEESATFTLALPKGRQYKRRSLSILIDAGIGQSLVDIALRRRPIAMPQRCIMPPTQADTASDLLGVVSVMDYLQSTEGGDVARYKQLADRAESLVASLLVTQREDGGWSWAGARGGQSHPQTTARAVWALSRARQMGLGTGEGIAKAVGYLKAAGSKAKQEDYELKAVIAHALGAAGKGDFGVANRLYRLRNSLSPAALAYTALALAKLDRAPMSQELLVILEGKSKATQTELRVPAAGNQAWMRSDDEMTALALLAWTRVKADAPAARKAQAYLQSHQPWSPSRAQGPALAALAAWHAKEKAFVDDYRLTIKVNGKTVKKLEMTAKTSATTIDVPATGVKDGENRIDFTLAGRGRPHVLAVLSGFSKDVAAPPGVQRRFSIRDRIYKAAPPEYDGTPVPVGFSILQGSYNKHVNKVSALPVGKVTYVEIRINRHQNHRVPQHDDDYLVLREALPAGATLLADSVKGNFEYYTVADDAITFYLGPRRYVGTIQYGLAGYAPGSYRVLPAVVESIYDRRHTAYGKPSALAILAPGEKSNDPYKPTPDELYALGEKHFNDGHFKKAGEHLEKLFAEWGTRLRDDKYRETARMLLFVSIEGGDDRRIVRYFEIIKEKYPTLVIPFDKVLAVGDAYRELKEYERALLVFKATIAASFVKDARVAGVLTEQERRLDGIRYMKDLWRTYPDLPSVMDAYLALSDMLYELAPNAHTIGELKEKKVTRQDLMLEAIRILTRYLTLYGENPTADDAALNLVNAYLALKDYKSTVTLCRVLRERFPKSPFFDSFQYVEALAQWNLGANDEAVELARAVSERKIKLGDGTVKRSENRDLALYIIGQIWHARGKPEEAIAFYSKVKEKFADAAEAIDYFERPKLSLDEVTSLAPGKKASMTVKYRNIPEVHLLVYRVDLMTLYLTEKNLSGITKVKLAGIHPALDPVTVKLGDGKDYADKEKKVTLGIKEPGAYLVIARGGDLHASGMVVVTPLALEVQEDAQSGRVRVNCIDKPKGEYLRDVHVKVIGSDNGDFVAGETDLRGVFVAENIRGKATVIARDKEGRFAFYRGERSLGAPRDDKRHKSELAQGKEVNFLSNVYGANQKVQDARLNANRLFLSQEAKGVQVDQVLQQSE